MKVTLSTVLLALLCALAPRPTSADVLIGHLSGLARPDRQVDLRVRFFDHMRAERWLVEQRFEQVDLRAGSFEIDFEASSLPAAARFIEIALRPSNREYAAFEPIPPRRRLERSGRDGWVAVADTSERPDPANAFDPVITAIRIHSKAHDERGIPE